MTWLDGLQTGVLLVAAPFLLFPTVVPWATGGVCLLIAVILLLRWRLEGAAPVTPLNGALMIWLAMIAVGAIVSAFPDHTLPKLTGLLLGALTWLTMVRGGWRRAWGAWGLAAVGVAIAGQGLVTTDWPTKIPLLRALVAKLPAALATLPGGPEGGVHANQLGGALVPYLPFLLSLGIGALGRAEGTGDRVGQRREDRERRWTGRLGTVVGLGAALIAVGGVVALSQSRSAWIGAGVSCLAVAGLWGGLLPRGALRAGLRIGLLLAVVGAIAGAAGLGPERLARVWQEPAVAEAVGGVNTLSFRFEVWRWALMGVQDFFFTGCGLGAFREVGRLLYPMNIQPSYDYAHAHNIFLQVALDTGVPGLIAYLALVGIAARQAWVSARDRPAEQAWALGLLGGLIALHVFGLTDALAPGAKPGLIFWMMLGLIGRLGRPQRGAQSL